MVWPLRAFEDVGVVREEREPRAPVLKDEAALGGNDAAAEAAECAVYEAAAVAVDVGDGKVDCVGGLEGRGAVGYRWVGGGGGEEGGAGGEVGGGEEAGDGNGGDGRVGDPPVSVREGDAEGFDYGVEVSANKLSVGVAVEKKKWRGTQSRYVHNPCALYQAAEYHLASPSAQ